MDQNMAARIAKRFITLPLDKRTLFLEKMLGEGVSPANLPIPAVQSEVERIPLSFAQERQWFLWQLEPTSTAYHLSVALRMQGELDVQALERSFNALIERHQTLRTTFEQTDDGAVQVIAPQLSLKVVVEQAEPVPDALAREGVIKAFVDAQTQALFDLQQGPLLRVRLLRLAAHEHIMVIAQHHIVSDAASLQVMVSDLVQLYAAASLGQPADLAPLPIQYADYAIWQRRWMEAGERERQLAYWTDQLGAEQPVLELPLDRPRPAVQSYRGARLDIVLDTALGQGLQQLAQQQNVTPFMLLLASFQTLLHRYSRQDDIRIGVPVANRNRVETEGLIGFFVNTQVLKADFTEALRFCDLLQQVKHTAMQAQAYQDLPFGHLVEALQPERNLSLTPLFQVLYNHRGSARDASSEKPTHPQPLLIESLDWEITSAQFDLTLNTVESAEGIAATLTYATDLFDRSTVERLAGHWQNLLRGIVANPQHAIAELPLLDASEQQQNLKQWNPDTAHCPSERCLHHLIEAQAERTPQAIAVSLGQQQLTYAQLNSRANQLAHALIEHQVGPDVMVGLAVERSLEMIIGLLAILKAGGAYVPLDPAYPQERLAYMMQDSGLALLLTQAEVRDRLPIPAQVRTLLIDAHEPDRFSSANPQVALDPANLAYVIYTSGSTGNPKGALLAHHNVLRLFKATEGWFQFGPQDVWSLFHSYAFDFSVWEIFGALLYGGRLAIVPQEVSRSPEDFFTLLCDEGVTVLNQTPSAFKQLLQVACAPEQAGASLALRYVVFGGEALDVQSLRPWFQRFGDQQPQLINMYGITETTVHVTYRPITLADLQQEACSPIGVPIPDLSWYLLDAHLNPVPKGCIGELYIGRAGLARGYLKRADLSATRFIPDPFGAPGERLYRTGDLARYRADGVIEYAGRIDHQVKIRGFRIELGEIEARLLHLPQIREAVVLAQAGPNGQQLVAYVVPNNAPDGAEASGALRDEIKARLKEELPDYMVPAHLLFIPQLPLTANGKLDRKALPQPDASQLQRAYVAPQSELEQRLAALWQSVLKLPQVGLNDNFFELGGDSIISIQLVSRARQAGIRFSPKDLFQHQTVRSLANVAQTTQDSEQIDQGAVTGTTPLLAIQQMFFETPIPQRQHWNQSVMLKPAKPLDGELLEQTLQHLTRHHDALRLCFSEDHGQWHATFLAPQPSTRLLWQASVANSDELEHWAEKAQASLDLHAGPLLRGLLATLQDGSQRLLLVVHHLAVDGVSWRILFEDLQHAYTQLLNGQAVALQDKTSAVKDWAEQLQRHARSEALQQELAYWQEQLQDVPATLPCDRPDGGLQNRHGRSLETRLDPHLTRQLLQDAPAAYRTQINDLLLTALARVLQRWTGYSSNLIQLEGHGREELFDHLDLTRTVGWFTSVFPVKLSLAADLGDSIKQIKEQLRAIPNKGIGFGALRYLGDPQTRDTLSRLPEPRITFNYLGQFDGSFDREQGALFAPAEESTGANQSPQAPLGNWLSLNGQVYGGELKIGWGYSSDMFDDATIQRLADDFARELALVIEHCCDPRHQGLTPADFPVARVTQQQLDRLPVPANRVEDLYPLSPMQQGMLFHSLEASGDSLYINQMSVAVEGLDPERFIAAWNSAIARHEILRSGFWSASELAEPLQVVYKSATLPTRLLDWQDRPFDPQALEALLAEDCAEGFDLLRAPLTRLTLVKLDEQRHHLIWTSHHILMDGWSSSRLLGEVFELYNGRPAPAIRGHYRDYIQWLQNQSQATLEQFWKDKLQGFGGSTSLSNSLSPRPAADLPGHAALYLNWDEGQTRRLREQAQRLRVTPNTLIQATWLLLLQRYTGQESVCFGATVAGRPASLPGAEDVLGLFINTLPIIQAPQPQALLGQWLQDLQSYNLEVRDHEHASLADVQRWSGHGGQALFDSIIVFENYPVDERLQEAGQNQLSFGEVSNRDVTNFAMDLAINLGTTLKIEFLYLRNRFTADATEQVRRSFETLLLAMLDQPDATLGSLGMLAAAEQHALLLSNQLPAPSTCLPLLAEVVRHHASTRPEALAVVCGDSRLTYGELEARANRLAHYLISQGVGPEVFVGIALERSVEVIVAFYAVMKTGGAYVPLDIDYPPERIQWIVEDSAMGVLITQSALASRFEGLSTPRLELDRLQLDTQPSTCPATAVLDDNLAYLIYTSGSTGKPKGVAVSHGQIRMHCQAIAQRYEMDVNTRELLFMSFAFDGAQERWLATLLSGAQLVVRGNQLWTPEETWHALHGHQISIACFPPAYLQQLAEFAESQDQPPPPVRIYCFGGDAVAEANFELVKRALKPAYLTNGYGPTETVVTPLLWKVNADQHCGAVYAPIGTRIGERTLYVLDEQLNPLPNGVAGELYIGGEGVARGYHQRPGLSAERFVVDPFSASGSRLYRTGDLVRQRADGVIDYLGRLDNQVKIRGFRIELGEIEARLREQAPVQDAVVVARETSAGKQLIGYVVAAPDPSLGEQLRSALGRELPDYMVPSQILVLAVLPLNPNGKLDRLALPDPDFKGRAFVAPRNALEQALASIWQEVLELEQVGVTDNFFELGGDSLRILKVLSKVRGRSDLGIELKLRDMIGKPTIAELSGYDPEAHNSLDPLLLLNSRVATRRPLFCLHAGFGTVFDYEPLARRLEGQRSVYGLQCRMLLDRHWEDESLGAMAIDYAQYIRQKQADGPYHLLGWSLGGTLALLVAQELESQGQQVEFLGLVDSFVPSLTPEADNDDWSDDLRSFLAVIFGLPAHQLPAFSLRAHSDLATLEPLIAGVQQALASASAYAGISSDELAHTFSVAMKLKALSLQLDALPETRSRPYCWWAKANASDPDQHLAAAQANEQLLAGHFDILKQAAFLEDALQQLEQPETVAP
ncbi:non-ribosomal peptide synthetase [Pseudomonas sp. CF161]|uniref:non-ribosomal peptide synthetase n=1 Tax=Pseudomonas sp. CF161 TaxID=911241 RepID=UPI00035522AB|nr:non-ribosomal peptide synthetase [Pseudomonas sp. CF161]EPL03311.1 peptide synthase [Pseudomonas sp. CF161]